MERDFLDEIIEKHAERNPDLPNLVDAALERRRQRRKQQSPGVVGVRSAPRACRVPPSSATPK